MPPRSIWSWTSCARNPNCVCAGAGFNIHKNIPIEWENHDKTIQFWWDPHFWGDSWQGHPIFAETDIPNLQLFRDSTGRLVHQRRSDEDLGLFQPQESHPSLHPNIQATNQPTKQATKQPTKQPTKQATNQASKQPSNQATKQPPSQPNHPANQTNPNQIKPSQTLSTHPCCVHSPTWACIPSCALPWLQRPHLSTYGIWFYIFLYPVINQIADRADLQKTSPAHPDDSSSS